MWFFWIVVGILIAALYDEAFGQMDHTESLLYDMEDCIKRLDDAGDNLPEILNAREYVVQVLYNAIRRVTIIDGKDRRKYNG